MGHLGYDPYDKRVRGDVSPAAVTASAAVGRELEPVGIDPDLDDPRIAAARYRALFAELAAARAKLDERTQAGAHQRGAQARRHREAAEMIRERVSDVWETVGPPLVQYGVSDLDQLRPAAGDGDGDRDGDGGVPLPSVGPADSGRPAARVGRAGRAMARAGTRPPGAAAPGTSRALVAAEVDPKQALADAHNKCMEAMAKAAELRAVLRASASTSAGFAAGAACLLVGAGTALARLGFTTPAGPCLAIGALVVWTAVSALTDAGRLIALRAGMVGAGSAGIAVLATLRVVPGDTVGIAAALVAVAVAIRFGIGLGGGGNGGSGGSGGKGGSSGKGGSGGKRR